MPQRAYLKALDNVYDGGALYWGGSYALTRGLHVLYACIHTTVLTLRYCVLLDLHTVKCLIIMS